MQALVSYLQGKRQHIAHKELKYSSFSTLNLTKSLKGLTALPFLPMLPVFSHLLLSKMQLKLIAPLHLPHVKLNFTLNQS